MPMHVHTLRNMIVSEHLVGGVDEIVHRLEDVLRENGIQLHHHHDVGRAHVAQLLGISVGAPETGVGQRVRCLALDVLGELAGCCLLDRLVVCQVQDASPRARFRVFDQRRSFSGAGEGLDDQELRLGSDNDSLLGGGAH